MSRSLVFFLSVFRFGPNTAALRKRLPRVGFDERPFQLLQKEIEMERGSQG